MLSIFNTGLIFSFILLLNYLQPIFQLTYFQNILGIVSCGTIICGACLLLAQTTVQGFLITNSLINTGFIVLSCTSLLNLNPLDKFSLLIVILVYFVLYNSTIFILFNS